MNIGLLYFVQNPLLNGFTINNEAALIVNETVMVGRFQDMLALINASPNTAWITNIPRYFDGRNDSTDVQSFMRNLKAQDPILANDGFLNLNSLYSLLTFGNLNQTQWTCAYRSLMIALNWLSESYAISDYRTMLTSKSKLLNGSDDLDFLGNDQVLSSLKLLEQNGGILRPPSKKNIASITTNAIISLQNMYPLFSVDGDIEYVQIDLPHNLSDLKVDHLTMVKINHSDNELINVILPGGTGYLTLTVTKMLLQNQILKHEYLEHALLIKNSSPLKIPDFFCNRLDVLSVTKQITAVLFLKSYYLLTAESESESLLLKLQITQFLWAQSISMATELSQHGFKYQMIDLNQVNIELDESQIPEYMRYCYTNLYDVDRRIFTIYNKHSKVGHG